LAAAARCPPPSRDRRLDAGAALRDRRLPPQRRARELGVCHGSHRIRGFGVRSATSIGGIGRRRAGSGSYRWSGDIG
jgi:hypothetical protein